MSASIAHVSSRNRAKLSHVFQTLAWRPTLVEHRGKTYAHASTLAFPVCTIFLVLCLFSRKFYKVCNKQLSLLLQQKSLREYAFLFLNFISLSGKEIPKILAAMQGVRTSVSIIINQCLLFSSS